MTQSGSGNSSSKKEARIAELLRIIREADRELRELTGGEGALAAESTGSNVSSSDKGREDFSREKGKGRRTALEPLEILDALPANIGLLDEKGVVLAVNQAWRDFAGENDFPGEDCGVGDNYLEICRKAKGDRSEESGTAAEGIQGVLSGRKAQFSLEYPCHAPHEKRWFRLMVTPYHAEGTRGAVVTHFDITERKLAELQRLNLINELGERVKELRALHDIATLLRVGKNSIPELFEKTAEALIYGFQFPSITAVSISCGNYTYQTEHYRNTPWTLETKFETQEGSGGWIRVAYLEEPENAGELLFFPEERSLIESVAKMLRSYFETKNAMDVLRDREALLSSAQRVANMGSWSVDLDTGKLTWSRETYALFGVSPDNFKGTSEEFYRLIHSEDRERLKGFHREMDKEKTEKIRETEYRIIRPDGKVRWMFVRGELTRDPSGKVVRRFGIVQDITQRKEAETQLQLLESSVEQLNDILMITRAEPLEEPGPEIVFVNRAVERITGYSPEELIGRTPRVFQGPKTQEDRLEHIREALREGREVREELINYNKEGEEYWIEIAIQPIFDRSGMISHFGAIERDITDRKNSEEFQNLLVRALNEMADMILITDKNGTIEWVNRAFVEVTGYSFSEAIGKNPRDLLKSGKHDKAFFKNLWNTILSGEVWSGEIINRDKAGNLYEEFVTINPVSGENDEISHFIAIKRDLTEEKKRKQQELRSQRMESIGNLAGGIAHDLNNVLSPILMSIELLKKREKEAANRSILETIEKSTMRGADLVRQVLTFSRGVEGDRVPIALGDIVADIEKLIRETFPKNIHFESRIPDDLWMVKADPTQLHQVLTNFCINARDAMPEGGGLTLELNNSVVDEAYAKMNPQSQPGAYVMMKIEDTGEGIPPEIQEQIFDPFFTTKEPGKGTGLGLSTSQRIIKDHRGFINLYSEPGKGTLFKIYLPALADKDSQESHAVTESGLPRGNGELILLVDDEENVRDVVRKVLERYGYRVVTAENGVEAVALYSRRGEEIDAVLTDMSMPVMDGYSTIMALRSLDPEVKVIGSSGQGSNSGIAKALGAGVKHFISKPYTAERVLRAIYQILQEEDENATQG